MRAVASFASSEAGKAFARIEERFGRDPAAALEPVDDVLAHNLRAALILTLAEDQPEEEDPVKRAKRGAEEIKRLVNG